MKVKNKFIIIHIILFAFIFSFFAGLIISVQTVRAKEIEFTDVMTDLKKDETFNVEDYNSYSLDEFKSLNDINEANNKPIIPYASIITISEGNNGELFIYTYEPTAEKHSIELTTINMYCSDVMINDPPKGSIKPYNVEQVSKDSVFSKYLVKDYTVMQCAYRYYNLVSIHRDYDSAIDGDIPTGSIAVEKAIKVGKQFCCYTINDEYVVECCELDVLELTSLYAGNLQLRKYDFWLNLAGVTENTWVYFLVFVADKYVVDYVFDMDCQYTKAQFYKYVLPTQSYSTYPIDENKDGITDIFDETFTDNCELTMSGYGLLRNRTYSWNHIRSGVDFKKMLEDDEIVLSDTLVNELVKDNAWVVILGSTEVKKVTNIDQNGIPTSIYTTGEIIEKAQILRLRFQSGLNVYNLGVVSDKLTADLIADGHDKALTKKDLEEFFSKLMAVLLVLALMMALVFFAPVIWPGIKAVLKWLWDIIVAILTFTFDGIVWLVTLPVELIKKLFK